MIPVVFVRTFVDPFAEGDTSSTTHGGSQAGGDDYSRSERAYDSTSNRYPHLENAMQVRNAPPRPTTRTILRLAILMVLAGVAHADNVTFYTSSSTFNTANPGLPVEGFQSAQLTPPNLALQNAPLNSSTNSSVFPAGSILPGLSISNLNPANTPGLIVYPGGVVSGSSIAVGTNWFGDTLVVSFDQGVTAAGMDVFAATGQGPTLPGLFSAKVYDGSTLLGSTTFSELQGNFAFVGVSSNLPITSLQLLYLTNDATTFVDNIAFGGTSGSPQPPGPPPPVPDPSATPEPSTWVLVGTGALLLALFDRRRVRRAFHSQRTAIGS